MSDSRLLQTVDLPAGFTYPDDYLRVISNEFDAIGPWHFLLGDVLRERQEGLRVRFPARSLVVFARRQDNDDVACWDLSSTSVAIVHDFAGPGWEHRGNFVDFAAWARSAVDDMLEF